MEPYDYAAQRDEDAAKWESHFPLCEDCEEHIVEGESYPDEEKVGGWYHWECFENLYKKTMPDWREL